MFDVVVKPSEAPLVEDGRFYHLRIRRGEIPPYVLLPGDPDRVWLISSLWDEKRLVAENREYRTIVGKYRGVDIATTSTGIGGPATAIAVEELLRAGAHTFIRVGTTGSISRDVKVGELVISKAAVRLEGTSKQYVIPEYPAYSDYEVLLALVEAAETLNVKYHLGVTASTDSFYTGQGRPGFRGYTQSWMENIIPDLQKSGVINFEMEAATLLTLSSIYNCRAGVVCSVIANRVSGEFIPEIGVEDAARVACEAVRILSEWDVKKVERGKRYFYPSLILRG